MSKAIITWKRHEAGVPRVDPAPAFVNAPGAVQDSGPAIFTPPEDVLKLQIRDQAIVIASLRKQNAELKQMLELGSPAPQQAAPEASKPEPKAKAALTGAQRAKLCRERKKQQTVEH